MSAPDGTVIFCLLYPPHRISRFEISPDALGSIPQIVFEQFSNNFYDSLEFHIVGDFHLPKVSWSNMSSTCSLELGCMKFLSDKFTSALLHSLSGGNSLDNILVNDFQFVSLLSIDKDSFVSDHYPIFMQYDRGSCKSTVPSLSSTFTFNSAQQMTVFCELCSSFSFLDYPDSSVVDFYHQPKNSIPSSFNKKVRKTNCTVLLPIANYALAEICQHLTQKMH